MSERRIDLTGGRTETLALLIPALDRCIEVAALHSPFDDEMGYLIFDSEPMVLDVRLHDIFVLEGRKGRGTTEFAIALLDKFEAALGA